MNDVAKTAQAQHGDKPGEKGLIAFKGGIMSVYTFCVSILRLYIGGEDVFQDDLNNYYALIIV